MFYPNNIAIQFKKISKPDNNDVICFNLSTISGSGPNRLKLTNGYLSFNGIPDWQYESNNVEQFVSLHRWNWLLRSLTDEENIPKIEWGVNLIRSWINTMGVLPEGLASESYTVAERISNTVLYFKFQTGSWDKVPEDIKHAIAIKAYYLAGNIEYHPAGMAGNHVVNNARALLLASYVLHDKSYRKLAIELLRERLPILILNDGFFREGSSHYHFLITRWLLEIRYVASEFDDTEITEFINIYVQKMLNVCNALLVSDMNGDYHLPLIGDVSPDCEPDWIKYLPWSRLTSFAPKLKIQKNKLKGWCKLFLPTSVVDLDTDFKSESSEDNTFLSFPESGWYRMDAFGWTTIWHAEKVSGNAIASHSHHDLSSFVTYYQGEKIIIDPGRYSYDGNSLGYYGSTSLSHTSIQIDGVSPALSTRDRFYPTKYRNVDVKVSGTINSELCTFSLYHNGFSRLSLGEVKHSRIFYFTKDSFEIVDDIDGNGLRNIDVSFQWAGVPNGCMISESDAAGKTITSNSIFNNLYFTSNLNPQKLIKNKIYIASDKPIKGWNFPAYGEKIPSVTQDISLVAELPAKLKFKIRIGQL